LVHLLLYADYETPVSFRRFRSAWRQVAGLLAVQKSVVLLITTG
jgi:hypothetical protein